MKGGFWSLDGDVFFNYVMHFIIILKQSKDAEIKKTAVEPEFFFN
jgi:hypothetical protein